MKLSRWLPLLAVLLVALTLRLALWGNLPRQGMISDEAEYLAAASWLAQGRGFTWHQGWLWTRAPFYPLFLAAHIRLFGFNLTPIYMSQTLLSMLNVALVYVLALENRKAVPAVGAQRSVPLHLFPTLAALLAALYLPFAMYSQMVLGETLYLTLLLSAFVVLAVWSRQKAVAQRHLPPAGVAPRFISASFLVAARCWLLFPGGVLLGLATLTRGLTLGFVPLVALWVWNRAKGEGHKAKRNALLAGCLFTFAYCLVLVPWSLHASRVYGGFVLVDTTGAFNLLLGARTAYDGTRSDAPTRNFVLALLDAQLSQSERRTMLANTCLMRQDDPRLLAALERPAMEISQAERQSLMMSEGLCLLWTKPGAFVLKSIAELVDLFQINYTGAERMSGGFSLGRLPRWYTVALFLLDDTLYVVMLPLAVMGWARSCGQRAENQEKIAQNRAWTGPLIPGSRFPAPGFRLFVLCSQFSVLVGWWWLYNLLTAPLLFAINRFRIPLLPFVCIYAAALVESKEQRTKDKEQRTENREQGREKRGLRQLFVPGSLFAALIALFLALIATTPYAYLQAAPSEWASYLGPYPSSITNTLIAWENRPTYVHEQQVIAALGRGDGAEARRLLAVQKVYTHTLKLALPLLAGLEGSPARGLALLPNPEGIAKQKSWQASVVRGDLLRRLGDWDGARAAFTPEYVDAQNPVEWAWDWLHPPPTRRIDLGGNLDLGYIQGFYLGEGDTTPEGNGTFRWSGGVARLRFPAQGSALSQTVCLRADGRGWPRDMAVPVVALSMRNPSSTSSPDASSPFATFIVERKVEVYCADVPPTMPGADLVIALDTDVFVPNAADLLAQQGPQVGQLRLLGVRLDWAELR